MAIDPTDDEIYRRLMPAGGHAATSAPAPDPAPDPERPGDGLAGRPAALAALHVSPAALRAAGQAAGRLGTTTTTARSRLAHAHDGLAKAAPGFAFTAAVADLHTSWHGRLTAITTDCDQIDSLCQDAAKAHEITDTEVRDSMA